METNNLTHILLFWGGITGAVVIIIGIVNLLMHGNKDKNDQSILVCGSDFSFGYFANKIRPKHKLILRSVSEEPVGVKFVRYYIKPRGFLRRLFKEKTWETKRWIYDDTLKDALYIEEEEKGEIQINLPIWVAIPDVLKVDIYDQAGKAYAVKWPLPSKLAVLIHYEKLYETEEKNKDQACKIIGYTASGNYHIYALWNPTSPRKGAFKGKLFHFKKKIAYEKRLKDMVENQRPELLACKIDEIT